MLQTFLGGFGRNRTAPESFRLGKDTIPAEDATMRHLREARRNYAAQQESTATRRTPEQGGGYADPIGDALKSFWGWATTPLRQNMGGPSPRDINIQNPNDPRNRQIVDQLGPQEQDLITQAYVGPDERSPVRRWWDSTQFPPAAAARGAWNTFVGQASPLDVALEAAGAGIATRGSRTARGIGGARATPAPTTRGDQSAIMKAYDETGDMPWEEYGTYGQDIIDRLVEEADQATRAPSSGTSIADDAFRMADEATRPPDVTDINTRRGNRDLPEGGSLMGKGTPETGPTGYTPHGGSLLDNALSGHGDNVDFINTGEVRRPDEPILPELDFSRQDEPFHVEDLLDELARFVGDETNPPSPVIKPSDVQKLIDKGKVRIRPDGSLQVLDESITGGSAIDNAFDDAPEYLNDPGSPDAIEAAQEKKINDRIEEWMKEHEDPIQDAFDGLDKSELREKYPDLDNRTIDEIMEHKRMEDEWDAMFGGEEEYLEELKRMEEEGIVPPGAADDLMEDLFSDEALEGADEMLDLGDPIQDAVDEIPDDVLDRMGDHVDITDDLRKIQNGEMSLKELSEKYPELTFEEIDALGSIHITDSEIDDAVDAVFGDDQTRISINTNDPKIGSDSEIDDAINDLLQGATDDASIRENDAVLEAFEKVQEGNFDDLTPQDIRRVYDRDVAQEVLRDYYKGAMTESDVEETLGLSIEKLEEAFGFDFDDLLGT